MSPRNVILICGLSLILLGGIVLLVDYLKKHPSAEEVSPQQETREKFKPEQPVGFQHPDFDLHTDCGLCHQGYTLRDTVLLGK